MSYKVFLFDNDRWLYCNDVTFKDGVYKARVINGNWNLCFDTSTGILDTGRDNFDAKLIWACDPETALFNYNDVINAARERYAAGELADYELKPVPAYEEETFDDEVPF